MDKKLFQECIQAVNERIASKGYQIALARPKDMEAVYEFVDANVKHDCMEIDLSDYTVLYAFDMQSEKIVAHLAIALDSTPDGEEFIAIGMSCTDIDHRRRRLTSYLRLAVFLYAIQDPNVQYIASDVNSSSKAVLEKFGFVGEVGGFLEKFNWIYSSFVETNDPVFVARVEQFFS